MNQVQLFNSSAGVSPLVSLPQDWTSAVPRLRVRIRHQEVAGISTVFFEAENSTLWEPDLSGPLTPDVTNTSRVPVDNITFPTVSGSSEFGFGNYSLGGYFADYETVRIIRSSEPDTVLPAALALSIPTLSEPVIALFAILIVVGGWVLLARFRP